LVVRWDGAGERPEQQVEVLPGGQLVEQRRVVQQHGHGPPERHRALVGRIADDGDRALGRWTEAVAAVQQRGLAGAVRTGQGQTRTGRHVEIQLTEQPVVTSGHAETAGTDGGRADPGVRFPHTWKHYRRRTRRDPGSGSTTDAGRTGVART
jgi:hypothetical protein